MLTLDLGPELRLPALEAQTQTYIVFGGKGMGKTNATAVFAEECDANRLRFSWLDPVGVAWGLKHSADGRGDGVAVLILGGVHGDLAITPQAGMVVADFVVDEDVSVIIDISRRADGRMWTANEKIEFVTAYCTRLFERQGERRRPIMQLIDECGRFAPQVISSGRKDLAACKDAIEQIVELGRNVGIGAWLTTQRSARIDKSVSELADVMIGFRTIGPRSVGAVIDWFGDHIPKAREHELIEQLRKLARGTALVVSPGWLNLEGEYALRARRTFDSSDTPVAGQERRPTGKGARLPDLDKYRELMTETIEQAEATDPDKLGKKLAAQTATITRLEREIAELRTLGNVEPPAPEEVEVEVIVERIPDDVRDALAELCREVSGIETAATAGVKMAAALLDQVDKANKTAARTRTEPKTPVVTPKPKPTRTAHRAAPERIVTALPPASPEEVADVNLKAGARKMLTVLARQYPLKVTGRQLATLCGIRFRAGTYNSYLSMLNVNDLIEKQDDFLLLTARGWAVIGKDPADMAPVTTDEVVAMYRSKLKSGARGMLDSLIEVWPDGLAGEELAAHLGIAYRMGTYNSYLSMLNVNGLIKKVDGLIFANESVLQLQ